MFHLQATNYIGEICRYLLATHNNNRVVDHKVRVMTGNGLRRDIWKQFQDTFKIQHIVEFYGSTEGNANLGNYFGILFYGFYYAVYHYIRQCGIFISQRFFL